MSNIQELMQKQRALDESYAKILAADFLPLDEIKGEQIEEWRESLAQNQYVVAVCGQMKAGKSTLLNALLFGRLVLPADDTVMTAKITVVRYATEPSIEVKFYNQAEWNELKEYYDQAKTNGDEQLHADFHGELSASFLEGVTEHDTIKSQGRVDRKPGLDALSQYVSVVARGGKYSPFVKEVTVYHTNEAFKGIDIVDTPGINDPNVMRTQVTTSWIHKADAVIYVSYAGQAIAKADKDFITAHLAGVLPERRILVLNKIDCANEDEVRSYVEELRNSSDPQIKAIIAPAEQTSFVSAGAALVNRASQSTDLDEMTQAAVEDLEWNLDGKPYLEEGRDGFTEMEAVIADRLIATKGDALISSHQENLKLFKAQVKGYFQSQLDQFTEERSRLNLSKDALLALKSTLKDQEDSLTLLLAKVSEEALIRAAQVSKSLREDLERFVSGVQQSFKKEWEPEKIDFSSFQFTAVNILTSTWAQNRTKLNRAINKATDQFTELLGELINEIEDASRAREDAVDLASVMRLGGVQLALEASMRSQIKALQTSIENSIEGRVRAIEPPDSLGRVIDFFTDEHKNRVKQNVITDVTKSTNQGVDELSLGLMDVISEQFNESGKKIGAQLRNAVEETTRTLQLEIESASKSYKERLADVVGRERVVIERQDKVLSVLNEIG